MDEVTGERLRQFQVLADPALSDLPADRLVLELLDRLRTALSVDTATVLLLDRDAQQLVAVASQGLQAEVQEDFRIDVGRGFAGSVAQGRRPIILHRVDSTTVHNPVLAARGLNALLGVPMITAGDVAGVLHVGSVRPRDFTPDDIVLARMAGDRIGLSSRAQRSNADRSATLALQRSLLPTELANHAGLDLAARYLPGHELGVGGDWYDVFDTPSGRVGVVVGDVAGSGLRAAVVMGRLRSALRAYSLDSEDPAEVLTRLDRKIRYFEAGNLATVLFAVIDPIDGTATISLAGHPPPILAAPGQSAELLNLPVDVPVGVGGASHRRNTVVQVPPGGLLVAYTDGLVERRGEIIDVGFKRLVDAVRVGPAETVCRAVLATLSDEDRRDDIAIIAIGRTNPIPT